MGAWTSTLRSPNHLEESDSTVLITQPSSYHLDRKRKLAECKSVPPESNRRRLGPDNSMAATAGSERPGELDDRDIRKLEAPVQSKYLLRALREEDGTLRLDIAGEPLYSDSFLEKMAGSASVLTEFSECAGSSVTGPEISFAEQRRNSFPGHGGENVAEEASAAVLRRKPRGAGEQMNFLDFAVRKALRKKQVIFNRSAEVTKQLNIARTDEAGVPRLGAFGERDVKQINLQDKLFLAPLTTNGNLPYRRVCKQLGVDITCGEMALAQNLLQGQNSEWALMRRHRDEDVFGVQLAGSNAEMLSRAAEIVARECEVDFIDLNAGCPIDLVYQRGAGCALMGRGSKFCRTVASMSRVIDVPLSVKMRMGIDLESRNAHDLIPKIARSGASWITIHGRTRKQRYSRIADWEYITGPCGQAAKESGISLVGNGDIYNWQDAAQYLQGGERADVGIDSVMLARGSLIKPWLATEIKERRDWDISSSERLEIYKNFCRFGLDHWGSDARGVANTRKFLLEWLSFTYRYVPIGLLEANYESVTMNHRSPYFRGRNELETLMGSHASADWIKITEMMLGPVPASFVFQARHKSNAWGAEAVMNG
jgi:nifR3 family TIM-barrel protein